MPCPLKQPPARGRSNQPRAGFGQPCRCAAEQRQPLVRVQAGIEELLVSVDGDKRAQAFVPDKSGKPRQPQLGY